MRFFERAVDGAEGVGGAQSPDVGAGVAVFDCVAGEEDFAAAGRDAEVGRERAEAFDGGGAREVCDGGLEGGVGLGLETDADDVEGGDWVGLLAGVDKIAKTGVKRKCVTLPINEVNKLPDTADSIFCPVVISIFPF